MTNYTSSITERHNYCIQHPSTSSRSVCVLSSALYLTIFLRVLSELVVDCRFLQTCAMQLTRLVHLLDVPRSLLTAFWLFRPPSAVLLQRSTTFWLFRPPSVVLLHARDASHSDAPASTSTAIFVSYTACHMSPLTHFIDITHLFHALFSLSLPHFRNSQFFPSDADNRTT